MTYELSGNYYIVALLSKSYLTVTGISLNQKFEIDNPILTCINSRKEQNVTIVQTLIIEKFVIMFYD